MSLKNLFKVAAAAAVIYGAYKLGERRAEKRYNPSDTDNEDKDLLDHVDEGLQKGMDKMSEDIKYVQDLITNLQNKPNKTKSDKNTLDLLKIKMEQMLKGR